MRDHGGDLDRAKGQYGGTGWLDLSTGINPCPYPLPELAPEVWATLPTRSAISQLEDTASRAYQTPAAVVALAGAQAAIQLVPRLGPAGKAAVLTPTYNEHAASLRAQGWQVQEAEGLEGLSGADLAVVVNPNNPDGRAWSPMDLLEIKREVGILVVDESFADPTPALSLAPHLDMRSRDIIVLRSFGKFYGLAGLRLGFAVTGAAQADALRALAGPWAVSGPAVAAGAAALGDAAWHSATVARLQSDCARLDALAQTAGWPLVGGTELFRTYATGDAQAAQAKLARAQVWTRIFPYSHSWLRLGLPGTTAQWAQLETALSA